MPSSSQRSSTPSSRLRSNSEYSLWSDAIGAVAAARRMSDGSASERPMKRTLPASTSSAIAPTVSSIGSVGIDAMALVQVDHVDPEPAQARLA